MSRMVKACTPDAHMLRSMASTERSPTMATFAGSTFGAYPKMSVSSAGPLTDAARQRHAVDVAAGAAFGRVHVGVRVDPDQAQLLATA